MSSRREACVRARFRIIISGGLGEIGREAFRDFDIKRVGSNTALTGDLDRSGLHGALTRIQGLALELVEVTRLPSRTPLTGPTQETARSATQLGMRGTCRPGAATPDLSMQGTSGKQAVFSPNGGSRLRS